MNKYFEIIDKFKGKSVAIIGDVMLDKYIWGEVERISPEAPVPIVSVNKENYVPGGAANVANNISAFGAKAYLVGIVGKDEAKKILENELKKNKISSSLIEDVRPTIQKVRVIVQNQQLLRIDYEDKKYIEEHVESKIIDLIEKIKKIDVIIISDYGKGIITKNLIKYIVKFAHERKIKVVVDPKPKHTDYYKDVDVITPNTKEAMEMTKMSVSSERDIEEIGFCLYEKINSNIIITRGKDGMTLIKKDKTKYNIPTKVKEVFDVSGAGDTVVALLALCLSSGCDLYDAAYIANHAAGIVVGKIGTATTNVDELKLSIEEDLKT